MVHTPLFLVLKQFKSTYEPNTDTFGNLHIPPEVTLSRSLTPNLILAVTLTPTDCDPKKKYYEEQTEHP